VISSLNHLEMGYLMLNSSSLFFSSDPANEFLIKCVAALLSSNTHCPERPRDGDSDSGGYFDNEVGEEGDRVDVNDAAGTGE
jgi:hypothetical protein